MDVEAGLAQHLATLGSPYMSAFPPVFTWHGTVEIDDLFGTIDRWLQSLGIRPESWSQPVDGRDLISRLHDV